MFSIIVAVLFAIRNKIVLFLRKTENPILNCFYCIIQYHHFQKCTIDYTFYGIQN